MGHTNTIHVYSVIVMTHVIALEDGQSSLGHLSLLHRCLLNVWLCVTCKQHSEQCHALLSTNIAPVVPPMFEITSCRVVEKRTTILV